MSPIERVIYRLACWWLSSPRVDRVRRRVAAFQQIQSSKGETDA